MMVGKQRMPESRSYFYQDLMLPVLLDSLRGGWQANELARPLARLKAMDNNGLLRRTLQAWFRHNVQPLATSKALFIHRNTLEYRLNRISELTGWISVALTTGCCCISRCSWTNNAKTWRQKCRAATRHTRPDDACCLEWIETTSPAQRAAGMLLLTGELFQIGFDFADLIGDHAFQMA